MRVFLLILSLLWIVSGTTIVLHTVQARSFLKEIVLRVNIRIWAALAAAVGILLFVAAFMVKEVFWVALILGLLAIAKGTYLALSPAQRIQSLLEWWFDRASETTIRLWGLIAFTLGVMLFSWLM